MLMKIRITSIDTNGFNKVIKRARTLYNILGENKISDTEIEFTVDDANPLKSPNQGNKFSKFTNKEKEDIIQDYENGMSMNKLARKYDSCYVTIKNVIDTFSKK